MAKSADDMRTEYSFTDYQNEALTELLAKPATADILLTDLSAIDGQARELLQGLPADLSPERRAAVEAACRLVGRVNYFWGGKSLVIGWVPSYKKVNPEKLSAADRHLLPVSALMP